MASLKLLFANVYQGLVYEGKIDKKDVFSRYWPSAYIDQYASFSPDIVCLTEVPLDDEQGNGRFAAELAKTIGAPYFKTDTHDRSWIMEDKYYGNALISKLPLKDYASLNLPHPPLEYDRPDGAHWVLHDKPMQSVTISFGGRDIRLFNLHYFAYFMFGRNMNEPAFEESRTAFIQQLRLADGIPTIVAGDFNNGDDHLEVAFPELFAEDKLLDAVTFSKEHFDHRYIGGKFQLDHILYSAGKFRVLNKAVIVDSSDHKAIFVELSLA